MPRNIDLTEPVEVLLKDVLLKHYEYFSSLVTPPFLYDEPYKRFLTATALGDGKIESICKKARVSEKTGKMIANTLIRHNTLYLEESREAPLRKHPKQKLKKSLRNYTVQHKLRFCKPFERFWFGFVVPFESSLVQGDLDPFFSHFSSRFERLYTFVYERLCAVLLMDDYPSIQTDGSFWDYRNEFDIVAVSRHEIIIAECKYKERKVCKNELNKLKQKAKQSGINANRYVLFSKSGFSNELMQLQEPDILLYDLSALKRLLEP